MHRLLNFLLSHQFHKVFIAFYWTPLSVFPELQEAEMADMLKWKFPLSFSHFSTLLRNQWGESYSHLYSNHIDNGIGVHKRKWQRKSMLNDKNGKKLSLITGNPGGTRAIIKQGHCNQHKKYLQKHQRGITHHHPEYLLISHQRQMHTHSGPSGLTPQYTEVF